MAGLITLIHGENFRRGAVICGAVLVGIASLFALMGSVTSHPIFYSVPVGIIGILIFIGDIAISGYIIFVSTKARQYLVTAITIIQLILLCAVEYLALSDHATIPELFLDQLSGIMAAIIGIIGGLICVYALGYMREYHTEHPERPDKRPQFFGIMFLFLSAMFGVVFSNNLLWLFFFWEITTLCSYLLIRYPETDEAIKNAFRALLFNLVGGACIPIAFIVIFLSHGSDLIGLHELVVAGPGIALIPAGLIGIAGLAKSAQFPFSSWLVGAMVAPTPVSALLHSSTMVKAGVYIIARFAPVFEGQLIGILIALIGGVTFLAASAIAISQSNAKKVLAYSTIANLGLIVACCGVGTAEALWAAILLIIFHAIAKSLLFLSVGTVEHQIHSRDIEDMTGLVTKMPRITMIILIGIAGMFLAPFGMLISKWASLHAFVESVPPFGILLVIIIAYGSGITAFFWAKWMGKLIAVGEPQQKDESHIPKSEKNILYILSALTIGVCFGFPIISWYLIEPWLQNIYQSVTELISLSNIEIMFMMLFLVLIMPFSLARFSRSASRVPRYLCGIPESRSTEFIGSCGITREIELSNYYLDKIFGEERLSRISVGIGIFLIVLILNIIIVGGGL
ncbi:NADH-quinone oxidoreductase subunit L [Methanospirillum stamsii]|uniref:NADH-quinone oxidoreductase subunit L n=1 Tax=Methanospirillum stamsii TaxID=1277351 RepID=A0A2V2MW93_9EURY|nr:NADH-quinone oxidoreductase subunit L [Methanospirillum stamsii]